MVAQAGGLVLNDLKAQNEVQLTADELRQLIPNAKVVSHQKEGSSRRWTNEPDGKLVASSDIRRNISKLGRSSIGQGTWHIGDMELIALRLIGLNDLKIGAGTYSRWVRNITALSSQRWSDNCA
ncbi:hypothetical protein SCD_n02331 [Sulfuricella denitrificans skB26]|uniref:Uncharacterized protein n=1 Tax=Sulfuricella denitrificans (strain DSM 22764 / NBRC 105220 / skB26) TaxID=1163617 RepID=S6AMU7_SULDS|nr:hypothetical protein SCD_n02331 [Sulfuricella denitrificans skB26]